MIETAPPLAPGAPGAPTPEAPRWYIGHVSPLANGESRLAIVATVPGVTFAEVAWFLCRALIPDLIRRGGAFLPTREQVESERSAAALLESSPAVRIYARNGETVWIGHVAEQAIGPALLAYGFTAIGPVPGDVKKVCDRAAAEAAFDARYLTGPLPNTGPVEPG